MSYLFIATIFFLTALAIIAQPLANEIVFHGGPNYFESQIYSIRADGSGQINLTNDPSVPHFSPSWSPDGTKILYVRNYSMCVMNADGTNKIQLATPPQGSHEHPVWSPDGSQIAYEVTDHFTSSLIYVMNADGNNQRQLTFVGYSDGVDWSPDGNKIVFSRLDFSGQNIYVMNADGTGQTAIPQHCVSNVYPNWSPDGSKIAFSCYNDLAFAPAVICTMNANGSNAACITYEKGRDDFYPSWSPDSSRLTFSGWGYSTGYSQIYVIKADGTNLVQVTQNAFNSFDPDWKRAAPAAQHQLSGRVTTSAGRGVPRGRVTLDNGAGNVRVAITNPFGYFRFENVPASTYTASVRSKSYTFTPRAVNVSTSITDLDFVALENP
ncbi:MAG: beta-sandwich domain-containing protein [Blastocatellia bacterium]